METLKRGLVEFGSQDALDLLSANGLVDLESVFQCGETIHSRYMAKNVSVATLRHNDQPVQVFIKKQWKHARLIPRMHAFRSGKAFWSYPLCEWRGLLNLQEIGLDTAEPLALFQHRWNPYRAAVITRAVPCELNLYQMITNGTLEGLDGTVQSSLGNAIVSVIERIHNAGLGWRSMSIKHFFPAQQDDGSWRIWLIDCEGVFGPVKPHYIKRERRSLVNMIRSLCDEQSVSKKFIESIERRLL